MRALVESQVRGLLELAPDAIVITNSAGRIVLVNRQVEHMLGYDRAALIGQPVEMLLPERFRMAHRDHRADYQRAPRSRSMGSGLDLSCRCADGREVPVEISLSPMEADDDTLVISVIRDVSERKRIEEAHRQLEREKDEFLANISHDLRTPLTAIKASIGVVLANEPPGTSPPLRRMFVNIDLAADRMIKLVDDLLELAQIQAGLTQLRLDQVDLRTLVRQAAQTIEPLALERGQRITVSVPSRRLLATVDPERIGRVLLNLLSNAQKYGREGGEIQLSLHRRRSAAVVQVVDDGDGIPPGDQEHIFNRFYRRTRDTEGGRLGHGLGLAIARTLVDLHGGTIWVESTPGYGATFSVSLPLARIERAGNKETRS